MTWYELFLVLHISMVIIWVGGGFRLISFIAGMAYLGPTSGKIKAEIDANGTSPARNS